MLAKNKAIFTIGIVTATFYIIAVALLTKIESKVPDFTYETFNVKLEEFNECYSGDGAAIAQEVYQTDIFTYSQKELYELFDTKFYTQCNSRFVKSSPKQIKEMAMFLVDNIDKKLLDVVYTAPENFYAIANQPQEYLFYAMNDEKTSIGAYLVSRDGDKIKYEVLFDTSNDAKAQESVQLLLIMYREIVKI